MCVCAFLAVIELLFGSVLKVEFYIMKWNVIYKCACVYVLNFYFAYLSLRHRTIFYIEHYSYLWCVCACMRVRSCRCVCAFGCCFVSTNGLLVDVCQCCCLLMFVCLPLSRHFPCCKTWWTKNLNLSLGIPFYYKLNLRSLTGDSTLLQTECEIFPWGFHSTAN